MTDLLSAWREYQQMTSEQRAALEPPVVEFGGQRWAMQTKWLRHTQNPTDHSYPKTGTIIRVTGHPINAWNGMLPDGVYLVQMVEEWEPGGLRNTRRDIRLILTGPEDSPRNMAGDGGWDAANLMEHAEVVCFTNACPAQYEGGT